MLELKGLLRVGGLSLLIGSGVSCSSNAFTSHWRDREISIDGDQQEWFGNLLVPEGQHVTIGVMNDDAYLYLTMSSTDRSTMMQIMRFGLTVWFDPRGGKKKVLGIKYPMGGLEGGMGAAAGRLRGRNERPDWEAQLQSVRESQLWVEVLGPDKDDLARVGVKNEGGIQVEIGASSYGQLVYELRIPFVPTPGNPYALNTSPGETIGIGIETGAIDRDALRSPRGGGGRRGGMPGGGLPGGGLPGAGRRAGGMRGGGMRGGSPGRQMPQPLKYWTRVTLAAGPSSGL